MMPNIVMQNDFVINCQIEEAEKKDKKKENFVFSSSLLSKMCP